jgi:hypothetical protein
MESFDTTFPRVLSELHQLEFYDGGQGIDFDPFEEFQSAAENADWARAWTGESECTGSQLRIFGHCGSGGYAAFWLIRSGADVLAQPVVYFGSEGDVGMIARNFAEYVWLLAAGLGPREVCITRDEGKRIAAFEEFAMKHAPFARRTPKEIVDAARAEFPSFEENFLDALR